MFYTYFHSKTDDGRVMLPTANAYNLLAVDLNGLEEVGDGYVWEPLEGETEMEGISRFRKVLESVGGTDALFGKGKRISYLTPIMLDKDQRWAPESLKAEIESVKQQLD